jgi:hypothetical protein
LVGKPEGKRPLGTLEVDGKLILKWILEKCDWGVNWINLADPYEHCNEQNYIYVYKISNIKQYKINTLKFVGRDGSSNSLDKIHATGCRTQK